MEEAYYLDEGPRVIPSSPLEVDILRQAILADRFVFDTELPDTLVDLAIKRGGRLFYDPQWSVELIMHYAVGEHLGRGQFELTVTFYNKQTGKYSGTLQLGTALGLSAVPHDVQGAFKKSYWRSRRSTFFLPRWCVLPDREPSADLQIKTHEKAHWRLLAFEDIHQEIREYRSVLPHVVLVDPERLTAKSLEPS